MSIAPRANVVFCPAVDTRVFGGRGYRTCLVAAFLLLAAFCCRAASTDPLTQKEREWLRAHGPLRYAPHLFAPPLEFRGASNVVFGVTPELLGVIVTNLGLQREWVFSSASPLEVVAEGRADFALAYAETRDRDARLKFTEPFLWVSNVFFVRRDAGLRKAVDLEGKHVGVVQGSSAHEWLQAQPLRVDIIPVGTIREGLLLLSAGRLAAMLCPDWVGQHLGMATGLINLRTLPQSPLATPQQFVVARTNEHLLSILQKGIDRIDAGERERIVRSWASSRATDPHRPMPPWIWKSLLVTAAFMLALVLWNLMLRRQVAQRTRELQASEEHFRVLYENAPVAYQSLDIEGRILDVNAAWLEMLGYPREEVLGRPIAEFLEPSQVTLLQERFPKFKATGRVCGAEFVFRRKDGEPVVVSVEGRIGRDEAGNFKRTHCVLHNITERKRAEAAVRESRALLHSIIEGTDDAVFVKDIKGRYLLFNGAAARMTGKAPAVVLGCDDTALFAPEEARKLMANDQRIIKQGQVETFDESITFADDKKHTLLVIKGPLRDERGQVVGLFGISRDVTERTQITEALRVSEARLAAAQRIARLGSWELGLENLHELNANPLWWSDEVYRIFGYEPGEVNVTNDLFFQAVHPEDRARLAATVEGAVRERKPYEMDHRIVLPGGAERSVHEQAEIVCDNTGKPLKLSGTVQDITERRVAERLVAEKEQFISAVAESTPDYIVVFDLELRLAVYRNKKMFELLGYSDAEEETFGGQIVFRLMHPDDVPQFQAHLQKLNSAPDHSVLSFEYRMRHKKGGYSWFLARDTVFQRDAQGRARQILSVAQDITERKNAEELRAHLEAQLRQAQKMEAVGQLAGGVAHDFNNILAALLMNLNLLQQRREAAPEIQTDLADMQLLVERAAALTRQLLLFGRRQVMQPRVLDLNSLLGNLLKMLGRLIGEHITLVFQGGQQAFWVEADPGMMEQVITNLVVNARDAMPRGGHLTLRARTIIADDDYVAAHPQARPGTFVALSVQDTGIGMDETTRKRIFEPFFTTKDVGKGTGLGLSTVYGIVEQHQGWIEVETAVGKGSTFTVCLPLRESPQAREDSASSVTPIAGGAETILVVEDEPAVRELIVRLLERYGYRVLDAATGPAALRVWQEHGSAVDLLISDMVMPDALSGIDVAERLRKLHPELRIILMSGYSAEMMCHGFGVPPGTSFLQKPFVPDALARLVREVLDDRPVRHVA